VLVFYGVFLTADWIIRVRYGHMRTWIDLITTLPSADWLAMTAAACLVWLRALRCDPTGELIRSDMHIVRLLLMYVLILPYCCSLAVYSILYWIFLDMR